MPPREKPKRITNLTDSYLHLAVSVILRAVADGKSQDAILSEEAKGWLLGTGVYWMEDMQIQPEQIREMV